MNLKDITAKCWIKALFIRSDGERFLLGDGMYDFLERQQHFNANEFANDVVDVQGNDGSLLAGQVRRATAQSFDGYVGDGTVSKTEVEAARRAFFMFFRKNYHYEVVYIFPDGSAIKRQRGYIVDAPEVKELWQLFPQYHVALNFEDVNYYTYAETDDGQELFGQSVDLTLAGGSTGGLVWDELGVVWDAHGKNFVNPDKYVDSFSGVNTTLTPIPNGLRATAIQGGTYRWVVLPIANADELLGKTITASMKFSSSVGEAYFQLYTINTVNKTLGTNFGSASVQTSGNTIKMTATVPNSLPSGSNSLGLLLYATRSVTVAANDYIDYTDIQIEIGNTATAYVPFTAGAVWEKGSGGSSTNIITVNSLDSVAPVWKISGPVTNPTLENITTNDSITFLGSLTASQTLTIDSNNMTADINGTNVLPLISGDWLELLPGTNRLVFSASAAEIETSRLEWQEIVG